MEYYLEKVNSTLKAKMLSVPSLEHHFENFNSLYVLKIDFFFLWLKLMLHLSCSVKH